MKTFSLLWLDGTGRNEEIACTKAPDFSTAVEHFRKRAPGLNSQGFQKWESCGAWTVAELFQSW